MPGSRMDYRRRAHFDPARERLPEITGRVTIRCRNCGHMGKVGIAVVMRTVCSKCGWSAARGGGKGLVPKSAPPIQREKRNADPYGLPPGYHERLAACRAQQGPPPWE